MNYINQMNLKHILKKYVQESVKWLSIAFLTYFISFSAWSLTYTIPSTGNVIGSFQKIQAERGQTMLSIAQQYDVGMYELFKVNQKLLNHRINPGVTVIIPSKFVLPSGARQGIVLNLAVMRVFYYHPDGVHVSTYPVGIGREGWSTPKGTTQIVSKKKDPAWRPTPSILREAARKGKHLPTYVAPGPNNPLGQYAMYLGFSGILMHGTNAPSSIGLRSSHGCIRLFPKDIEELFSMVSIGTPVRIVYEPIGVSE